MNFKLRMFESKEQEIKTRASAPSSDGQSESETRLEMEKLKSQLQIAQAKAQMLDTLQHEYDSVNEQYNKILTDNSSMAKQIEELHQRIQQQGFQESSVAYMKEEQGHFAKEKKRLLSHIENLEQQILELSNQNTVQDQEVLRLQASHQQLVFDNDTLRAQMVLVKGDGGQTNAFQNDYQRLHGQFAAAMEQKNKVQTEWNQAMHSLKQREARCQQLAMQVSHTIHLLFTVVIIIILDCVEQSSYYSLNKNSSE